MLKAIRTWRDGTTNTMPLDTAVANLRSNAADAKLRAEDVLDLRGRLRRGEVLATALAEFRACAGA